MLVFFRYSVVFQWLCIDANEYGNVARFINHSCEGNLIKQVSAIGYNRLLYGTCSRNFYNYEGIVNGVRH